MLRAGSNHRDPWFPPFYSQLLQDVKFIFGTTKGTSIIFPGEWHLMFQEQHRTCVRLTKTHQ